MARHGRRALMRWRRTRTALYFAVFFPVFLVFDVALKTWGTGLGLAKPATRRRRINALVRGFGCAITGLTRRVLGVTIDVAGHVPEGRHVVVSNHQSLADIPFLIWALRPLELKFVSRQDLERGVPTLSFCLTRGGMAAVSRGLSVRDFRRLQEMGQGLEDWGGSALVFAEGRRFEGGELGPYHLAAVRTLSEAARLPLLPVTIDGTHAAPRLGDLPRHLAGMRVRITVGAPVPCPDDDAACAEAVESIRAWTLEQLGRATEGADTTG